VARYIKDYGKKKIPHFKAECFVKFKKEDLEGWLKKKKWKKKRFYGKVLFDGETGYFMDTIWTPKGF